MATFYKINSLAIGPGEQVIYLGNNGGQLQCLDADQMRMRGAAQASASSIYAIAAHPGDPLVATMGIDCLVCLWDVSDPDRPALVSRINLRSLTPWNDTDTIPRHRSHSQALCFHPSLPRLAARSGNSGVVELDYAADSMCVIHCTRMHHDEDVTTLRYVLDGTKLASGGFGSVILSENGLIIANWRLGRSNVHWFEPLGDETYLIASDDRRVFKFSFAEGRVLEQGAVIPQDDLEHVTYNATSGRAYIAGFDRCVYEVDPSTCGLVDIAYRAPFKMRWIKTLNREPRTAFLQCFDGGVYKVDLAEKRCRSAVRHTPPAVWTGCALCDGGLALTGEGGEVAHVRYATSSSNRLPVISGLQRTLKGETSGYTKRMIVDRGGALWLGQSSGALIRSDPSGYRHLAQLNNPIRDIALNCAGDRILVCLENGEFHSLDAESGARRTAWRSPIGSPLWALAAHESEEVVAVGERHGRIHFLDTRTAELVRTGPPCRRVKRIKWLDANTLLYNVADSMNRYLWKEDSESSYVSVTGNTIEDFIWDEEYGYLVLINYDTNLILCDLETGARLHSGGDQNDFSKGLMWVRPVDRDAYPLTFITFGRDGSGHLFGVHDDKIIPFGRWGDSLLTARYIVDGMDYSQIEPT